MAQNYLNAETKRLVVDTRAVPAQPVREQVRFLNKLAAINHAFGVDIKVPLSMLESVKLTTTSEEMDRMIKTLMNKPEPAPETLCVDEFDPIGCFAEKMGALRKVLGTHNTIIPPMDVFDKLRSCAGETEVSALVLELLISRRMVLTPA